MLILMDRFWYPTWRIYEYWKALFCIIAKIKQLGTRCCGNNHTNNITNSDNDNWTHKSLGVIPGNSWGLYSHNQTKIKNLTNSKVMLCCWFSVMLFRFLFCQMLTGKMLKSISCKLRADDKQIMMYKRKWLITLIRWI